MRISSSAMQAPIVTDDRKKHYSFLNPLDDIAVPSAHLSLAPGLMVQSEKAASIRSLSMALHTLAGGRNSKQLPALPISLHDNGGLELGRTCSPGSEQATSTQSRSEREHISHGKSFKHIPRISLGETFSTQPFAALTNLSMDQPDFLKSSPHPTVSKMSHKRTSSEADTSRAEKRLSTRLSRPPSTYSPTRRQTLTNGQRPTTSANTNDPARDRKKSITYNDQRYIAPPLEQQPSRPATANQSPRRRFRMPASFKDLHFKSDRRRRLHQSNSPPPPLPLMKHLIEPETIASGASNQMTKKQALTEPTTLPHIESTLHDEFESKRFTRECIQSLALRADPPKAITMPLETSIVVPERSFERTSLFGPRLTVQNPTLLGHSSRLVGDQGERTIRHAHRFSEVESISSSILDYDWPQPEAYRSTTDQRLAAQDHGRPRPDSGIGGLLNVMNMAGKQGPYYPPPSSALPPTPGPTPKPPQQQQYYLAATENAHQAPTDTSAALLPPVSFSALTKTPPKSRLTALAEIKGLHMDLATANLDGSPSSDGEEAGPVLPSPLRLRTQRSRRSVRIDSLRRKHLSIHGKDSLSQLDSDEYCLNAVTWARRGSAPETMQSVDPYNRLSKHSFHRRCTSNDKNRGESPCLSPVGNHHRQNSRGSTTVRLSTSRVQKAQKVSPKSMRISASYPELLASSLTNVTIVRGPQSAVPHDARKSKDSVVSKQKLLRLSGRGVDFRRHSRQCSTESQPSTLRSSASTARSVDTEVTLPSPCEDETLRLSFPVNQLFLQGNMRAPSPLVSHFEVFEDRKPIDGQATQLVPPHQPVRQLKPTEHLISRQDNRMDSIGRSQKNTTLTTSRVTQRFEQDSQQRRTSKQKQARAQLAHDLQFELDQLEQMKRVYRAMHSARDRDRAFGHRARSYAQLLDDERFASMTDVKRPSSSDESEPSSRRTSHVIAKIEADLEHSPPRYRRVILDEISANITKGSRIVKNDESLPTDADAGISPAEASSTSPPRSSHSNKKPRNAGLSLFPFDRTPPKPRNIPSPASISSSNYVSYKSTLPRKPKSPSSTISSSGSKRSRKRYSFTSVYNSTTPLYSPTSSVFSDYRTPTSRSYSTQQQLTPPPEGRELQLAATIMSTAVGQDLNVDALVNSSSRIDQAIEVFTMGRS